MERLLRIKNGKEVKVSDRKVSVDITLSEYSLSQLERLRSRIEKEIERKQGTVEVEWEGEWTGDPTVKKPYLAVITPNQDQDQIGKPDRVFGQYEQRGLYSYKFLRLTRDSINPNRFYYYGCLKIGTVLRGRVFVGDEHFYLVTSDGLEVLGDKEARKLVLKMK